MTYKLLIAYDIDKEDESKRNDIEKYLMNPKYHSKWVHLQGSVWVVLSHKNSSEKLKILTKHLPHSLITVTDITKQEVKYNNYKDCSEPDGYVILLPIY